MSSRHHQKSVNCFFRFFLIKLESRGNFNMIYDFIRFEEK